MFYQNSQQLHKHPMTIKTLLNRLYLKRSLFFCVLIVITNSCFASAGAFDKRVPVRDSIVIQMNQKLKAGKVNLYTSDSSNLLFLSAKGEEGKIYQLFLFDMDGKLVRQTQVGHRQTVKLPSFEKGSYLFEIFTNDNRVQNGSIVIK